MLAMAASTRSSAMAGRRAWASSSAWRGDICSSGGVGVGVQPLVEELLGVEAGQVGAQELEQLGGLLDVHVPIQHYLAVVDRYDLDPVQAAGIGQESGLAPPARDDQLVGAVGPHGTSLLSA